MQIDLPATPKPGEGGFIDGIDDFLARKHVKNLPRVRELSHITLPSRRFRYWVSFLKRSLLK